MIPLGFLIFLTIKFLLFHLPFKLVTLSLLPAIISCVTSVVLIKVCSAEFPQMKPLSEIDTGLSGKSVRLGSTSTPYFKPSRAKYQSYRSTSIEFDMGTSARAIKFDLGRLKIT